MSPWTIHWVHASGTRLAAYLSESEADEARPVVFLGEDLPVVSLFNEVLQELRVSPAPWNVFHASHALAHLLSTVIKQRDRPVEISPSGVRKVAQSITFMNEHLHEPLKVRTLAALASLSPAHFTVLFRQQTGTSPHAYLHLLRMHRAVQCLGETTLSVKEIAAQLGFQDPFHFSRTFKAFSGAAPSDYRKAG